MLVQPVGHLPGRRAIAACFALDGQPPVRRARAVGQAVLAQLSVVGAERRRHADILTRNKPSGRAAVFGLQIPGVHPGAVGFAAQHAHALQCARRLANALIQPRLGGNQLAGQQPVGFVPGGHQRRAGRLAQDFLNRAQQMAADNRVVRRGDAHGGMLVDNALQHRGQRVGLVDMAGVGQHRGGQRLRLGAAGLIAQVEQIVQFGVGGKHALVKTLADGVAMLAQHGDAGVDIGAGGGG